MSAQENLNICKQFYNNFNNDDLESSVKYVSENIELLNVPFNLTLKGTEGFKKAMSLWKDSFSDAKVKVKNMIAFDEFVVTEFDGLGTHDGYIETPAGRIAPTGKKVVIPFCEILQFKNGKAVNSKLYYDTVTIKRQLELILEKV